MPAARLARLTFGPSPMNLAKRRWAPLAQPSQLSGSVDDDPIDDTILRPASPVRRHTATLNAYRFSLPDTELDGDSADESDDPASEEVRRDMHKSLLNH